MVAIIQQSFSILVIIKIAITVISSKIELMPIYSCNSKQINTRIKLFTTLNIRKKNKR